MSFQRLFVGELSFAKETRHDAQVGEFIIDQVLFRVGVILAVLRHDTARCWL